VRRLFELEVPEISNGIVEIKAVAREAGFRSKVAVAALQEGIDPVGSCVGLRGVRIQNVVNELGGERIDVIQWHAHSKVFIANALSPAQVVGVDVAEAEKSAVVVVPDGQLSLAIGKEGQNARLAAKLTGWKIDIKSQSVAEAERKTMVKEAPPVAAAEVKVEEPVPQVKERAARVKEPVPLEKEEVAVSEGIAQVEGAVAVPQKVEEEVEVIPYVAPTEVEAPAEKPQIRFAEDIFATKAVKPEFKKKEKKKKSFKEDREESRAKRARKLKVPSIDELEDLEE